MIRQCFLFAVIALCLCKDVLACGRQAAGHEEGATIESIQKFFKGIEESNLNDIKEACKEGVIPNMARVEVQNSGVSVLMTALDYAGTNASSPEVIDWLVKKGCDVNSQNKVTGSTPLMFAIAAQNGKNPPNLSAIGAILRRQEINVGISDHKKRTAKMYALTYCPAAAMGLLTAVPAGDEFEFVDNPAQRRLFQGITSGTCEIIKESLEEGADLDKGLTPKGVTPLVHAIFHCEKRDVFHLLYNGGVSFRKRVRGLTPLMMALTPIARHFDSECRWAHWMLESPDFDFDANEVDVAGRTALHYAVAINNSSIVKLLLAKDADPLKADDNGITPFSTAVMGAHANLEIVDVLAEFINNKKTPVDQPINTKNPGNTVINWVLQQAPINNGLLQVLAKYIPLDEQEPSHGTTLLMRYLSKIPPHIDAAHAHIEADANSNVVGNVGWPAIRYLLTADEFNKEFADDMLCKNARLDVRSPTGQTLFMLVLAKQKFAAADWLILQKPDLLNATDIVGWSAVHHAVIRSTAVADIRYLHEKGASLSGLAGKDTPLILAISQDKLDVIALLADLGGDVNMLSGGDMTPLGLALQMGNFEMVKILLEKGAQPDLLSAEYHPLLHIATGPGSIDAKIKLYKLMATRCDFSSMPVDQFKGWKFWLAENTTEEQKQALNEWEENNLPVPTRSTLFMLRNPEVPVGCRVAALGQ